MQNMLWSSVHEFGLLAYFIGFLVWFLIFVFLMDQTCKKSFFKSLIWPYFAVVGVRYWSKKRSFFASRSDYICDINELKCDPNYETKKR